MMPSSPHNTHLSHPARRALPLRRAFSLAEVIVATVLAVFIAGATATSLSQMIRAKGASASHHEAYARADLVASRIAQDLQCTLRDQNLTFTRLLIQDAPGIASASRDELLLLLRSLRPLRQDAVEGDEYEAQYRIAPALIATAQGEQLSDCFWRRVDTAHDDYLDAGGIATPLARGARSLSIEASNGEIWVPTWDSDREGLPHAVRIIVTASSDDGRTQATLRRIVAIDRVPLPPANAQETDGPATTDSPSTGTPGTGTPGTATPLPTPQGGGS